MHGEEPVMDIAHLGHVELLTPKPEESLRFFVEVMGMSESGRHGDSVFLRGWDDHEGPGLGPAAQRQLPHPRHAAFAGRHPLATRL